MRLLLRPVIFILLLAVVTSLGDGPFVDEVFAQETTTAMQVQAPAAPARHRHATQGASMMLVYTMLMNAGGITRHEAAAVPVQRHTIPHYASPHYASPPVSVPHQPPRTIPA